MYANLFQNSASRGVWHPYPTTRNEAVGMDEKGNLANSLYLQVMKILAVHGSHSLLLTTP